MATQTLGLRGTSYVEWSTIIAGAILAAAISLILIQFGNTLGLSVDKIRYEGDHVKWRIFIAGLWLLWTQLMASMAGGYLAGRMRAPLENAASHESEVRDGAHGLLVWALSSVLAAIAAGIIAVLTAVAVHHGVAEEPAANIPPELMRTSAMVFGFGLAASSIVSAVAAWWMATVGGDHRDRAVDVSSYISFRRTVVRRK